MCEYCKQKTNNTIAGKQFQLFKIYWDFERI